MAGNAVAGGGRIRDTVVEPWPLVSGTTGDVLVVAAGRVGVEGAPEKKACRGRMRCGPPSPAPDRWRHRARTGPRPGGGPARIGVGISPAYSVSAAVVEVECDAETGQVRVEAVWLAHDIGRA